VTAKKHPKGKRAEKQWNYFGVIVYSSLILLEPSGKINPK
jgi:hypothetical protein